MLKTQQIVIFYSSPEYTMVKLTDMSTRVTMETQDIDVVILNLILIFYILQNLVTYTVNLNVELILANHVFCVLVIIFSSY